MGMIHGLIHGLFQAYPEDQVLLELQVLLEEPDHKAVLEALVEREEEVSLVSCFK